MKSMIKYEVFIDKNKNKVTNSDKDNLTATFIQIVNKMTKEQAKLLLNYYEAKETVKYTMASDILHDSIIDNTHAKIKLAESLYNSYKMLYGDPKIFEKEEHQKYFIEYLKKYLYTKGVVF